MLYLRTSFAIANSKILFHKTKFFYFRKISDLKKKLFDEEINVLYDGKCNLCVNEVAFLKSQDTHHRIKFTDVECERYDCTLPQVDRLLIHLILFLMIH
jgi:hypothetical protein